MGGNYTGRSGCSGHTLQEHMSAVDGMPRLLRLALKAAWNDWCAVAVLDRFMEFRARPLDAAAAARATALWLAELEEERARDRALDAA